MYFSRACRAAGLPIGPGRMLQAIEAVNAAGIGTREDFYWTLHALFVNHPRQRHIFDQIFHVFWRNPRWLEKLAGLMLPELRVPVDDQQQLSQRAADALHHQPGDKSVELEQQEVQATLTWSDQQRFEQMDFESMSTEEVSAAKHAIDRMVLPVKEIWTRRYLPREHGNRIDRRKYLRQSVRQMGGGFSLPRKQRKTRRPPVVMLCDISGSMTQYSRMLLHFAFCLQKEMDGVHTFVFATGLSNITRYLRQRDVDVAMDKVGSSVTDWKGGTRIGESLHDFNRYWSRRVLSQGAVVLLVTDGLDRGDGQQIDVEMARLKRSCRRLIWLNPLLRYKKFQPKATGIRRILPLVDEFRPIHNLESMAQLANILSQPFSKPEDMLMKWRQSLDQNDFGNINAAARPVEI